MEEEQLKGAIAIAKRLASSNKATRDRALRRLFPWLTSSSSSSSSSLSDEDLLKLWKGLFYCVWHDDHHPNLSQRLSSLLPLLPPTLASRFLSSFLSTLRREWSGIDHLRLDKFYSLLRLFVHNSFAFLRFHRWDPTLVHAVSSSFSQRSLLSTERGPPAAGVNYQIAHVFLEEMADFLPLQVDSFDLLLKPFFEVMRVSSDKMLVGKVKANVFERLLESGNFYLRNYLMEDGNAASAGDVDDGGSDNLAEKKLGKMALLFGFSKRFSDMVSSESIVQSSRKLLFELHERFSKLERDLQRSGIQLEWPKTKSLEVDVEDAVVIAGCSDDAADEILSNKDKKKKKKKKGSSSIKKKKKKKKKMEEDLGKPESPGTRAQNYDSPNNENVDVTEDEGKPLAFDELLWSNLQKKFEMVAAEEGICTPAGKAKKKKKRKRGESTDGKISKSGSPLSVEHDGSGSGKSSGKKSAKRVRFSMKNNLVWKPHSPLPPHSLRVPPSATPRGSALKKGVPPGPIKETTPPSSKKSKVKVKTSSSKKQLRKCPKSASPGVKRIRVLQI